MVIAFCPVAVPVDALTQARDAAADVQRALGMLTRLAGEAPTTTAALAIHQLIEPLPDLAALAALTALGRADDRCGKESR